MAPAEFEVPRTLAPRSSRFWPQSDLQSSWRKTGAPGGASARRYRRLYRSFIELRHHRVDAAEPWKSSSRWCRIRRVCLGKLLNLREKPSWGTSRPSCLLRSRGKWRPCSLPARARTRRKCGRFGAELGGYVRQEVSGVERWSCRRQRRATQMTAENAGWYLATAGPAREAPNQTILNASVGTSNSQRMLQASAR